MVTADGPRLYIAVQLPPPVTGLSAVNAAVVSRLRNFGQIAITDLSPPAARGKWAQRFGRLPRVLKAARMMWGAADVGSQKTFYMPCDGGAGLALNIILALVARVRGFRLFLHHHSFAYINRPSALMQILVLAAPQRTSHVVLCAGMGERLAESYRDVWRRAGATTFVLSNAFMIDPAAAGLPDDRSFTLLHLSNLTAAKGVLTFLSLFERLRASGIDVRARIAGPASEPQVKAALNGMEAKYGEYFEWIGPVYGEHKAAFLQSGDVFVFPTEYANEAQPLVLLEALSAGMPILTIARGCIGCDYDDSVGLVAPDGPSFLDRAEAWVHAVMHDPERLAKFREAAKAKAQAQQAEAEVQLDDLVTEMMRTR